MTRVLAAVSMTSAVTVVRSLIFMMRLTCAKNLPMRRKFPAVRRNGGDGLGVGEVVGIEIEPETPPVPGQDEGEFGVGQWPVVVGESDAAVELRVAGEAFFDAGHTDEEQAVGVAVVFVAQHFQGTGGQPFGFVDNEQFGVVVTRSVDDRCRRGGEVLVDAAFVDLAAEPASMGAAGRGDVFEDLAAWMAGAGVRGPWKRRRFGIWREEQFSAEMRVAREAERKRQAELMANLSPELVEAYRELQAAEASSGARIGCVRGGDMSDPKTVRALARLLSDHAE